MKWFVSVDAPRENDPTHCAGCGGELMPMAALTPVGAGDDRERSSSSSRAGATAGRSGVHEADAAATSEATAFRSPCGTSRSPSAARCCSPLRA